VDQNEPVILRNRDYSSRSSQDHSLDGKGIPLFHQFRHVFCCVPCKDIIDIDEMETSDDEGIMI
jgi:hypothetical protein